MPFGRSARKQRKAQEKQNARDLAVANRPMDRVDAGPKIQLGVQEEDEYLTVSPRGGARGILR